MLSFDLGEAKDLKQAATLLFDWLKNTEQSPNNGSFSAKLSLKSVSMDEFFSNAQGCAKIVFQSRDSDNAWWGLGIADLLQQKNNDEQKALSSVFTKTRFLDEHQIYFGAMRFDPCAHMEPHWQNFGVESFLLPMILISHLNGQIILSINYCAGFISWPHWQDQALSLLLILAVAKEEEETKLTQENFSHILSPTKIQYEEKVYKALSEISSSKAKLKVVLGSQNTVFLPQKKSAWALFKNLAIKQNKSFLFYFDLGQGQQFFGASPELLYQRQNEIIKTEAVAGTRPTSHSQNKNAQLRQDLTNSFKDVREHDLVANHIENLLNDLGLLDVKSEPTNIMNLNYVQHFHRIFRAKLGQIKDEKIIRKLHPTPAVGGVKRDWAYAFIREQEGFDRGLYAGPLGVIAKNQVEFCVAIRSALFFENQLNIYAACGIVEGSKPEEEWEELCNKQKLIMSLLSAT